MSAVIQNTKVVDETGRIKQIRDINGQTIKTLKHLLSLSRKKRTSKSLVICRCDLLNFLSQTISITK